MTPQELAYEIAKGIGETGVEGAYNSVSCSTAGDYPSGGFSQWEGSRFDNLMGYIDGGSKFAGRSYSDIVNSGQLQELKDLLGSKQGQEAQNIIAGNDCLGYANMLTNIAEFDDSRCIIYAGIWCPTSTYVVKRFVTKNNTMDLRTLYQSFKDAYWIAANVGTRYKMGYQNRAYNTFVYVSSLDLTTKYGVPEYNG